MSDFIFWLEGVDFDNTIFDTSDISTIRGSSLTLLRAPNYAHHFLAKLLGAENIEKIFTGASMGAWKLSGDENHIKSALNQLETELKTSGEDPQDIEKAKDETFEKKLSQIDPVPLAHMRFSFGLAKIASNTPDSPKPDNSAINTAIEIASAKAKANRYLNESNPRHAMQRDTNKVPPVSCAKASSRAAECQIFVGSDNDGFGENKLNVSRSVAARRVFGRWARQGFYNEHFGGDEDLFNWEEFNFVDSLHEMVEISAVEKSADRPTEENPFSPPQPLKNKIAVFYADGNKFGRIRDEICLASNKGAKNGRHYFSEQLLKLQNEEFLKHIIQELYNAADNASLEQIDRIALLSYNKKLKKNIYKLRLETLLWGGDEVKFVMPAWLGWWFAKAFFNTVENWEIDGHPLTFSAGLVFCNYKTPIRSARALARALCDNAKDNHAKENHDKTKPPANYLNVDVLESTDPPQEGIAELRARLTGCPNDNRLVIRGEEVGEYIDQIARLKGIDNCTPEDGKQNLPRSQVYKIIHETMKTKSLADGGQLAQEKFEKYLKQLGTEHGKKLDFSSLDLTSNCDGSQNFALNLYRLAQHWDYIDDFCTSSSLVSSTAAPTASSSTQEDMQ